MTQDLFRLQADCTLLPCLLHAFILVKQRMDNLNNTDNKSNMMPFSTGKGESHKRRRFQDYERSNPSAAGSGSLPPLIPARTRQHGHGQVLSANEMNMNVGNTLPSGSSSSSSFCQSSAAFESNRPPSPQDSISVYGGVQIIIPIHPPVTTSLLTVHLLVLLVQHFYRVIPFSIRAILVLLATSLLHLLLLRTSTTGRDNMILEEIIFTVLTHCLMLAAVEEMEKESLMRMNSPNKRRSDISTK